MAAWLIPALKAVLPHVGSIIAAAAPVFTRNRDAGSAPAELLGKQIAELQAAAMRNATQVKDLAAQLQTTVTALEEAALLAEARLRRVQWWSAAAALLSLLALSFALVAAIG